MQNSTFYDFVTEIRHLT